MVGIFKDPKSKAGPVVRKAEPDPHRGVILWHAESDALILVEDEAQAEELFNREPNVDPMPRKELKRILLETIYK
jgi:hypothetical protein